MLLEDTEVLLDFTKEASHSLKNLGVAYLSLYLDHNKFHFATPDHPTEHVPESLLRTPGCRTENVHVSGVANTARHLLLLINNKHPLLGHHAGCLSGTKEVSSWTRILEVTFPDALAAATDLAEVGVTLQFLQETLQTPFVGHNARKVRQEALKLGLLPEHGSVSHAEWQALPIIRPFIHGLHLQATDIILFGMLTAKLYSLESDVSLFKCSDLIKKWIVRMMKVTKTVESKFDIFLMTKSGLDLLSSQHLETREKVGTSAPIIDPVKKEDLRDKNMLLKMDELAKNHPYLELDSIPVNWDSLNNLLKPQRNSTNNTNKMSQLQSILAGVHFCVSHLRTLNLPRIRVVDFCSGAGHLGIFLAYHFPDCQVLLVETKWGSLRYAKERVDKLGLRNVTLCLAHMEQFIGRFELGVSLHACGSATDMVLQQAVRCGAGIVSSPCCYGKIVNSDSIRYPKSERFRGVIQHHDEFFKVSKLADHMSDNENYMKCVDMDRVEHLRDNGYQFVGISKLKPLTCSKKNNLIVAYK